ncbi:MAG TPA: glycine zipper 2TM domain-containing protein [Allosphingosinicella sp.]
MRKMLLAVSAATLTVPAVPMVAYAHDTGAYQGPTWRGQDGRLRCRRSNGTTGLVVGGAGGALVGRALDGGRSRATGTILGAAVGALVGREVQRGRSARRCR